MVGYLQGVSTNYDIRKRVFNKNSIKIDAVFVIELLVDYFINPLYIIIYNVCDEINYNLK
ncbi:S-ribosylhomocysteine lyase LuxS involved in autoinducer biosynthesis [Chryseobacterium jejuense]|nr:S-ribosylhomocysteine lyase LuxS involved in autoinducer biosynthesis [Chryseobacterium jejuense]